MTQIPEDLLPQVTNEGFVVISGKVPALRAFFSINCCWIDLKNNTWPVHPDTPLLDVKVRRALNKAIDRDALNSAFFGDKGELMYGVAHQHPTRPGWDPSWVTRFPDEYGYDPAAARALLNEAGYNSDNPLETNMFVFKLSTFSSADDVSESVAAFWQDIGVKVNLRNDDSATRRALRQNLDLDNHFQIAGTSSFPVIGYGFYNSGGIIGQGGGYQQIDTSQLLREIRLELDAEKADVMWRQLGELNYVRHTTIPLFWLPAEVVVDPSIVSGYVWPGAISGTWSHFENISATR